MSKFVYYIAYLKQDNAPIIPLLDETFKNELMYKELIDNKVLSFKLKKDLSLMINSYTDRSAASAIKSFHTNISKINTKKEIIKTSLLNDIKECNHVLSFSFDDMPLYFEEKISHIAKSIKGIVIDNKMNTYFPIDKGLKKLLAINGTSTFKKYNPMIDYRQKRKTIIITKEDKQRWDKNNKILIDEGLALSSSYDFNILTSNTNITPVDDIWNELIISHIVGYLSYCSLNNIDVAKEYEEYKQIYNLDTMLANHTSAPLIDALVKRKITDDLEFYQGYCEISILLLWVLGLTKYPSIKKKCDIIKQSSVFKNKEKKDKLYSLIHLKEKSELLDMFDLTSRLHNVIDEKKYFDRDIISFHLSTFLFVLNYDY